MLTYLAILSAALAGYAGIPPYAIAVATIALASLSYHEHTHLYERGRDLGLFKRVNATLMQSLLNALVVAGLAYGAGWIFRYI